jgi:hypothetical protein
MTTPVASAILPSLAALELGERRSDPFADRYHAIVAIFPRAVAPR